MLRPSCFIDILSLSNKLINIIKNRGLTHNGYHVLRPFRTISFLGPMIVLIGLYRLVVWTPALRGYQ
jgi:hypothetical protein